MSSGQEDKFIKARFINNSFFQHIRYKIYIWTKKFPLILERLFKIDQKYPLMSLNYLASMVNRIITI
jgi:hypothetical protein